MGFLRLLVDLITEYRMLSMDRLLTLPRELVCPHSKRVLVGNMCWG